MEIMEYSVLCIWVQWVPKPHRVKTLAAFISWAAVDATFNRRYAALSVTPQQFSLVALLMFKCRYLD